MRIEMNTPFILLSLLLLLASLPGASWSAQNMISSAYQQASIWDEPGFTSKDCRPLLKNAEQTYLSPEDRELTEKRFESGAKDLCSSRRPEQLLSPGDPLEVLVNEKGQPVAQDGEVNVDGKLETKKFYQVQRKSADGHMVKGWISEDELTKLSPPEPFESQLSQNMTESDPDFCPPGSKRDNGVDSVYSETSVFLKNIENNLALGSTKTASAIDHFACLHRQGSIQNIKRFRKPASDAAKAFGIPYGLIMCTMLIESGLKHRPEENDEYRGYGQFGSALVQDLSRLIKNPPYKQMLSEYEVKQGDIQFNSSQIRVKDDPRAVTAAVALALRWIYQDRFTAVGCKDCSSNLKLNRKDLYLLVAGYNYSPYSLERLVRRSPASLRKGFPPPDETRHYMMQMDRCMAKGNKLSFRGRSDQDDSLAKSREKECDAAFPH